MVSGVVALAVLAMLGGLSGRDGHPGPLAGLLDGLSRTVQEPVVLIPLVAATLVWLAYAFRRVLLWRKAVAPGPILVAPIENATSRQEVPVRDLGIQFQRALSLVNLAASEGATGSPEFIQLLNQTEFDVKNPFGLVGGMLGLVAPSHAYEARLTLLEREERPSCGAAVEMTILPRRLTIFHRHWEESWERALERAAHAIAADVLPRTRQCRGPWSPWRGRNLPDELFDQYQQARAKLAERRFEEALGHYYAALRLDPSNRDIGYELGVAQERLALWLDALLTYHRVFTAAQDTRLRRRGRGSPGRRIRRRVDLLARDGYISLLGSGERLARQWITTGDRPGPAGYAARDNERTNVRRQLREILSARYASLSSEALDIIEVDVDDAALKRERLVRNALKQALADPTPGGGKRQEARRRQEARLLVLFQVLAQHEARMFLHDTRFQNLRKVHPSMSRTSLQITEAWATRRLERAVGKPLTIDDVDERSVYRTVFGARVASKLRRMRTYTEHYDAACTFAIPLLHLGSRGGRTVGAADRKAAVAFAVRELHLAVDNAPGEMVAARWDWIVSEDPDLAALRKTSEFRAFESTRLPSPQGPPLRPTDVQHLELARHTSSLVSSVARRFEREWHKRAEIDDVDVDVHELLDWWNEELANWRTLGALAVNHRDWRTRLDWIRRMQSFALRHGQPPFISRHPLYSDNPLPGGANEIDDVAIKHVKAATTRMYELHDLVADQASGIHDGLPGRSWRSTLNELDERGKTLGHDERRALCHGRAALWSGLAMWFETEVDSRRAVEDAKGPLLSAIHQLPHPQRSARELPPPRVAPSAHGRTGDTAVNPALSSRFASARGHVPSAHVSSRPNFGESVVGIPPPSDT